MCGSTGMQMSFKNEIKIEGWIGVSREEVGVFYF